MKKLLGALIAVVVGAGIAQAGIEVLGIEVLGIEVLGIEVLCTDAPAGSTAEAIMMVNGIEVLSDVKPVDPMTNRATLMMPEITPGSYVQVRDPGGVVLGIEVLQ